jgi:hypothetical protein
MTAPENTRERLAEALRSVGYLEYNNGKDRPPEWHVFVDDANAALLPLIDTLLREQAEGIAAAIEGMESFAHGKNPTSEAHLIGYGTARRLAARIARTFGGER